MKVSYIAPDFVRISFHFVAKVFRFHCQNCILSVQTNTFGNLFCGRNFFFLVGIGCVNFLLFCQNFLVILSKAHSSWIEEFFGQFFLKICVFLFVFLDSGRRFFSFLRVISARLSILPWTCPEEVLGKLFWERNQV